MSEGENPRAQALVSVLTSLPETMFAVLDGAHFDDLPAHLSEAGISYDPLFLEGAHPSSRASGPHLVHLSGAEDAERVVNAVGDRAAVVFWSWPGDQDSIFKHLRGLNMVQIPRTAPVPPDVDPATLEPFETVFFRHADPNVMVALLPLLSDAQMSRLLGQAQGLVVDASDFNSRGTVRRPAGLPKATPGMLQLTQKQYDALSDRLAKGQRNRLRRYLRRNPPPTGQLEARKLDAVMDQSARTGADIGFKTEQGHARWAYLMQVTDGKVARMPEVRSLMRREGADPDRDVSKLMDVIVAQLRAKAPR